MLTTERLRFEPWAPGDQGLLYALKTKKSFSSGLLDAHLGKVRSMRLVMRTLEGCM
jgi:hypothetical protein